MSTAVGTRPPERGGSLALAEAAARALAAHLEQVLEECVERGIAPDGQEGLADCGEMELAEYPAVVARLAALLAELRERGC